MTEPILHTSTCVHCQRQFDWHYLTEVWYGPNGECCSRECQRADIQEATDKVQMKLEKE